MGTEFALDRYRVLIAILISLCAVIAVPTHGSQAIKTASQSLANLSDQERAEVVQAVLENAIAHPVTTFNVSWTEILSSENLTVGRFPKISGYTFKVLEPHEIEDSADHSGLMRYLVFSRIRATDGKVNVEVCRMTIGTCFGWFTSSSCFNGDFRLTQSGLWTGELRPSLSKVVRPIPLRQRVRQAS